MVRRRRSIDALATVDELRWLVVRDRLSRLMEFRVLAPRADLRAAMDAERARRVANGWTVDSVPRNVSFCFCDRGNDRICIAVEAYEPGHVPVSHGDPVRGKPAK
jgi:hypothetical protein